MITEKKEKQILMMSFFSGLMFAVAEFIFSIYSHSQSALTDAVYDASELVISNDYSRTSRLETRYCI